MFARTLIIAEMGGIAAILGRSRSDTAAANPATTLLTLRWTMGRPSPARKRLRPPSHASTSLRAARGSATRCAAAVCPSVRRPRTAADDRTGRPQWSEGCATDPARKRDAARRPGRCFWRGNVGARRPQRHCANRRSRSPRFDTSPCTPVTFLPISLTAAANSTSRRPVMKTWAPSFTNCFAVARPMPLLPPVTSALFPSSLPK